MANNISAKPLFTLNAATGTTTFSISNATIVGGAYFNVKFVATIYISDDTIVTPYVVGASAVLKTTPNNAGTGIFSIQPILENFVSPQYQGIKFSSGGSGASEYKGQAYSAKTQHPIHLIDKFARNYDSLKYFRIRFTIEGSLAPGMPVLEIAGQEVDSVNYMFFNAYLQHTDVLTAVLGDYGFDYDLTYPLLADGTNSHFLTNAPLIQSCGPQDYMTVSFLNEVQTTPSPTNMTSVIYWIYYRDGTNSGAQTVLNTDANGGVTTLGTYAEQHLLHFGIGPGNISNTSATYEAQFGSDLVDYITYRASRSFGQTEWYTLNINCPSGKGYEQIRLTWMNQYGGWDYYTFKMKSSKTLKTKKSTFTQTEGVWNEAFYQTQGWRGGVKDFTLSAKRTIKMNTDFISEEDAVWFESFINSPEVYMIEPFQRDDNDTIINKYVQPVRLKTSSFKQKTKVNDRLIQFSFEVEISKTLRTQTV
jgi:hypothetical protein|tara:strand:+ start:11024 stop:12451 length:1428 start_codon:yes stop_codon:yes gene_type:complete